MALSNVTPADVLNGRREQILQRRKDVQLRTFDRQRRYNMTVRELSGRLSLTVILSGPDLSQFC